MNPCQKSIDVYPYENEQCAKTGIKLHPCPYKSEVFFNLEKCNCCESCELKCSSEIAPMLFHHAL